MTKRERYDGPATVTKEQARALVALAHRHDKSVSDLNVWPDTLYKGHIYVTVPGANTLFGITPDGHTHS